MSSEGLGQQSGDKRGASAQGPGGGKRTRYGSGGPGPTPCRHFARGHCERGQSCGFFHDVSSGGGGGGGGGGAGGAPQPYGGGGYAPAPQLRYAAPLTQQPTAGGYGGQEDDGFAEGYLAGMAAQGQQMPPANGGQPPMGHMGGDPALYDPYGNQSAAAPPPYGQQYRASGGGIPHCMPVNMLLQPQMSATGFTKKPCRNWERGSCRYGSACGFGHSGAPGGGVTSQVSDCRHWLRGHCSMGPACQFAHTASLLGRDGSSRATASTSERKDVKKSVCRHWARGYCQMGEACGFAHTGAPGSSAVAAPAATDTDTATATTTETAEGAGAASDAAAPGGPETTIV